MAAVDVPAVDVPAVDVPGAIDVVCPKGAVGEATGSFVSRRWPMSWERCPQAKMSAALDSSQQKRRIVKG